MKHLKNYRLFENKSESYNKINYTEYIEYLYGSNDIYIDYYMVYNKKMDIDIVNHVDKRREDLNKVDLKEINDIFKLYFDCFKIEIDNKEILIDVRDDVSYFIAITKNTDYWYFIDFCYKDRFSDFYKCDQIEGLKECLKYYIVNMIL